MPVATHADIDAKLLVGMEVHVELATQSKMFTSAPNVAHARFDDAAPNSLCDPVVLGMPGVLPVIKHLPGHGLAQLDSHLDLPRISAPREELEAIDFAAFRPFHDLPLGMTAHLVFEGLNTAPATVDPAMIRLIRDEIGFAGRPVLGGSGAGAVTAFCGPIGFLGIAVPHLARMAVGTARHRVLVPATALTGALVGLACAVVANPPGLGTVIPLNVVTSLVGAPVVIAVLLRSRRLGAAW